MEGVKEGGFVNGYLKKKSTEMELCSKDLTCSFTFLVTGGEKKGIPWQLRLLKHGKLKPETLKDLRERGNI